MGGMIVSGARRTIFTIEPMVAIHSVRARKVLIVHVEVSIAKKNRQRNHKLHNLVQISERLNGDAESDVQGYRGKVHTGEWESGAPCGKIMKLY